MSKIIISCCATLIVFLGLTAVAVGQTVSAGIRIHEPLLDPLIGVSTPSFSYTSTGTRFAIGPTVEIEMKKGFALSFEALRHLVAYRNESASRSSGFTRTTFQTNTAGHAWELPLVLKKYVLAPT